MLLLWERYDFPDNARGQARNTALRRFLGQYRPCEVLALISRSGSRTTGYPTRRVVLPVLATYNVKGARLYDKPR